MALCHFLDAAGDPGVVGLGETQSAHVIFDMGIEAGRDEQHLRPMRFQARQPHLFEGLAQRCAIGATRQRYVHHVRRMTVSTAVRIVGMTKAREHQHALIAGENFFCAIAVMDIEIDNRHPLQCVLRHGMTHRQRDVVEHAKAHGAVVFGMVSGRTHAAERRLGLPAQHQIGGHDGGPCGTQRGIPAIRT